MVRRLIPILLTLFILALRPIATNPSDADDVKAQNFSFDTRMNYVSALANGIKTVNIMVAAKMGRTEEAVQAFTALNGKVLERYDAVGYFWGDIPTEEVPKLLSIADIDEFQFDGERGSLIEYYEPTDPSTLKPGSFWTRIKVGPSDNDSSKLPVLGAAQLEDDNPYLPWHRVGLPDLLKQHPTFDGRGTTVAVVGYELSDLLHPAMQDALTLDGKTIPKLAGILSVPRSDGGLYAVRIIADQLPELEPQYLELQMDHDIRSRSNSATFQGVTYALPGPGNYKIARLEHDGRVFEVLWSPSRGSVWVDTNKNDNFADEKELRDVNVDFSVGKFPAKKGDRSKPFAIPAAFAVTIDKDNSRIRFYVSAPYVGDGSIVAGKGFLDGKGNGVAPGARILYVSLGVAGHDLLSYHQNLKGFILAASRPDVDVVEGGENIVNPPFYGQTVTSLILDRLAVVYQKPMFFIEGDMGTGEHVFGVRDYMNSNDWRTLYGVNAPLRDNTLQSGPDNILSGTFKPDFLMPDSMYATSCDMPPDRRPFASYRVPPCYGAVGSQSQPVAAAAGLAAVLISAAKQTKTPYNLDRIAWALRSGARYLDQMGSSPVGIQGYGMPDIQSAWQLLSSSEPTPSFVVSSVSNGRFEDYRRAPHHGVGVNEYFGIHPGDSGSRNVTITRSSGPADATHYTLSWRGNDGTFTAPSDVELPLDKPVDISIGYSPKSMGVHQGILEIADPQNGTVLKGFLNTVAASLPLGENSPAVTWKADGGGIPLSHEACPLFDVQPNVASLSLHMALPAGTALTQIFSSPRLGPEWYLRRTVDAPESHSTILDNDDDTRYALFAHPPVGTWAFCVANFLAPARPPKKSTAPYIQPEVTLSVLTANVKLDTDNGRVRIRNDGGAMQNAALHVRLGYEEKHSVTIGPAGSTTEIDADVVDGTQVLLLEFQGADKTAGLATTVYNCADFASNPEVFKPQRCRFQDFREEPQIIEYRLPHDGQWKIFLYRLTGGDNTPVEVDVVQVPAGDNQKPLEKIPNQDDQVGLGLAARRELAERAEPVKIEGAQPVGPVAAGASVDESVHVDSTSKKAPGIPVAVTELYDLGAEDDASEFTVKMYPFDPTHSRPIALGLDIEPLPAPADSAAH